ncbi:MAG: cell division protein ZapE [Gammaproteobacteria bacterium]|jgi:cell division protein ZapE|nr:cell division protein ZapE [Gammaproteobacteria bacterium]
MQAKPSALYFEQVKTHELSADPAQEQVMQAFDILAESLDKPLILGGFFSRKVTPKGVYLFGPVGRGKTYLMDLFFKTLTCAKKRQHFYELMNEVHAELRLFQGERDPLRKVAQALAKQTQVLCLDEFFVEDIADAMILSAFLYYLFEAGVVLVTTSNIQPESLYSKGLQRDRFLPAIDLIKKNMTVLELSGEQDYRLEKKWCDERYHATSHDQEAYLQFHFKQLNQGAALLPLEFELTERKIRAVMRGPSVIWFDFSELCEQPRVAKDYLKLAEQYQSVLIGNLPILSADSEEAARRFIALVDTFYDQKILLIIAGAVSLEHLYQGERLQFEFERTKSRIFEMSSWSRV